MLALPLTSFLSLFAWVVVQSLVAADSGATNATDLDSNGLTNYEYWRCFAPPSETAYLAPIDDCQKLLLDQKLPKRAILATFRPEPRGGSPRKSLYILPLTLNYGRCDFQLNFDPNTPTSDEQSTWASIGLAATQLLSACSRNNGVTGGWVRTGDNDHLIVRMGNLFGHRSGVAEDVANVTTIPKPVTGTVETS